MKEAIQTASVNYPAAGRGAGCKPIEPAEAQLLAFAALRALDLAGFAIVPREVEIAPNAHGDQKATNVLPTRTPLPS
jgi:hypothetical protein